MRTSAQRYLHHHSQKPQQSRFAQLIRRAVHVIVSPHQHIFSSEIGCKVFNGDLCALHCRCGVVRLFGRW